jgi:hypothetical protein
MVHPMSYEADFDLPVWANGEKSPPLTYERSQELLKSGVVYPLNELTGRDVIKNPRLILFGGGVTELKAPRDLDLILIYDSFDRHAWLSNDFSRGADELGSAANEFESGNGTEIASHVFIDGVDVSVLSKDAADRYMWMGETENKQMFLDRMRLVFGRVDVLEEKMREHSTLESSEKMSKVAEALNGLPYLLLTANGVRPEKYAAVIIKNFADIRWGLGIPEPAAEGEEKEVVSGSMKKTIQALVDLNPKLGERAEKIFADTSDSENSLEAKEVVAEIVRFLTVTIEEETDNETFREMGYVVSKGVRQLVSTYNQGLNFLQASLEAGSVQIYGVPLENSVAFGGISYDYDFLLDDPSEVGGWREEDPELFQEIEDFKGTDADAGEKIIEKYGKEQLLKYLVDKRTSTGEQWKFWKILNSHVDGSDLASLVELLSDSRVMSTNDRSIRGYLLTKLEDLSEGEEKPEVSENLFREATAMLLGNFDKNSDDRRIFEMALMDFRSLIRISESLGVEASIDPLTDIGDFDRNFVEAFIEHIEDPEYEGEGMLHIVHTIELQSGFKMLGDVGINDLYTNEPRTLGRRRDRDISPEGSLRLTDEEFSALGFSFMGEGLTLEVYQFSDFTSGAHSEYAAQIKQIVGTDLNVVGKVDFQPKGSIGFSWGNMTNAIYTGIVDFSNLIKELDAGDVKLKYLGGYTNPQMAAFANHAGFDYVFVVKGDKLIRLTGEQVKGLADAGIRDLLGKPIEIEKVGVPELDSDSDIHTSVIVLGEISKVREAIAKRDKSRSKKDPRGRAAKILERQRRLKTRA